VNRCAGANSIVEISACANGFYSTKRVFTETSGCFSLRSAVSRLFTGTKFSLKNRGELARVQVVSYQRLESHKREPDRTRHGRKVAPRYHKHVPCFLLFFLDTFQSFTYLSGTKRFCGCLFLNQSYVVRY